MATEGAKHSPWSASARHAIWRSLAGGASPEGHGLAEVVVATSFALTLEDDGAILEVSLVVVVIQQVVLASSGKKAVTRGMKAAGQLHQLTTNGTNTRGAVGTENELTPLNGGGGGMCSQQGGDDRCHV